MPLRNSARRLYPSNPTANIRVWYSILYLCRWVELDGTTWYRVEAWAVPDPDNPFHNWTATGANAYFPDPTTTTTTYAKGAGDTHFFGQFAFGVCNPIGPTCETYDEWRGHAYHTTELFPGDHNTWMSGQIEAHQCFFSGMLFPQCQWVAWKAQTFYSGQNFPNDGGIQGASWYIVQ